MLERLDIDRIRRVLAHRGYDSWELYAEVRTQTHVTAEGRLISSRNAVSTGVSVRTTDRQGTRQFSTSRLDTEGVLAALSEIEAPGRPPNGPPTGSFEASDARAQRLNQLVRATWPESEGVRLLQMNFDAETREFAVVGPTGAPRRGREEWAGATAEWTVTQDDKTVPAKQELWAADIHTFLNLWETRNPFRARTESILRQTHPWPSPQGDIPVYWSPAAVARLVHLFLRGFEGDLVLENLSFLNEVKLPLPFPFSITEGPGADPDAIDHEGSPRKSLPIFRDGQPRALACNRRVADQLAVPPTGHCRRQSHLHSPQVGLWNSLVESNAPLASPLSQLTWGIGVGDFTVESYDPSTGGLTLRLSDARLIHQGELGEAIEALRWPTNLLGLLASFSALGDTAETFGFPVLKKGSRWVTQLAAPSAISASVAVPGAVPPAHYW